MSAECCPTCGSTALSTFVERGSFFSRCDACGIEGPATSWIAVAPRLTGRVVATREPSGEVVAVGTGGEVSDLVSRAAQEAALVRVSMEEPDA